ncbi:MULTISPECIES: hypothetical protein [unclassified Caballeronia]|uniref:hypothetical protein n=1 Tax=unclassified Caballeronia TaxID=2646786 RepID=UPI0020291E07|nr:MULTISPECIES: hypothetical protein [unclassified Caballeronia]
MPLILNNRWMLSVKSNKIIDLEYRVDTQFLQPEATLIVSFLAENPFIIFSREQLIYAGWGEAGSNPDFDPTRLGELMKTISEIFVRLPPGRPYLKFFPRLGYCLLADVRQAHSFEHNIELEDRRGGSLGIK